jgi:hypothetical protein
VQPEDDVGLRAEVVEERARGDLCRVGKLGERRLLVSLLGEQRRAGVDDRLTRPLLLALPE